MQFFLNDIKLFCFELLNCWLNKEFRTQLCSKVCIHCTDEIASKIISNSQKKSRAQSFSHGHR